jgi:hypothetical protein
MTDLEAWAEVSSTKFVSKPRRPIPNTDLEESDGFVLGYTTPETIKVAIEDDELRILFPRKEPASALSPSTSTSHSEARSPTGSLRERRLRARSSWQDASEASSASPSAGPSL